MASIVVNGGCQTCSSLMHVALEAMGKYSELTARVSRMKGSRDTELLEHLVQRYKEERDQAVREYEEHMIEHRARVMTA